VCCRYFKETQDEDAPKHAESILNYVLEYTEDPIPNIRLLAIDTLSQFSDLLKIDKKLCILVVKQIRSVFKNEKDEDVKEKIKVLYRALKRHL
jgi:hypothetical protein